MARVLFDNVSKLFGNVIAVDNISLEVKDKSFLVFVGPSGCGKTTCLRMLAGLEYPTSGNIYIGERIVNNMAPKDRDIAMVFQNYALYPHKKVFDNMAFGLLLRKYPKEEIHKRVSEAAHILGITELLDRKPAELSGGQRQRVAMGRAIVRKPQVFLFDEPLSNLDAKLRVQMRAELAKLHERLETTTIYVTHDQVEAMTMADDIVVMDRGRVLQIGSPLEVYNHPKNMFVAGFIGSPTMNFFNVAVTREAETLFAVGDGFKLAIPNHLGCRLEQMTRPDVCLGIRPEHFYDKRVKGSFPGGESFRAEIEVVEPIGSELILIASSGAAQLTACVDAQADIKPHIQMEFLVDMNQAHFFDLDTGEAY